MVLRGNCTLIAVRRFVTCFILGNLSLFLFLTVNSPSFFFLSFFFKTLILTSVLILQCFSEHLMKTEPLLPG